MLLSPWYPLGPISSSITFLVVVNRQTYFVDDSQGDLGLGLLRAIENASQSTIVLRLRQDRHVTDFDMRQILME